MQSTQRSIKSYTQPTIFSRLLPFLVFLSFVWVNFYTTMTNVNSLNFNFLSLDIVTTLLVQTVLFGLLDYVLFELLFFVYRFLIGFSIYSFMLPKQVLKDKFRLWYMIRNIVLGFLFNLRFFYPFIGVYLCIFELMFNFLFIIAMYFDISRQHIEPLVGQFVFKTLAVPVIIYEIYTVITLMVGVL